jgi:ribosomal protein S18 acetylase RimI-like enzyme
MNGNEKIKKFETEKRDKIEIDRVSLDDVKKIWKIRNHPQNRYNFDNSSFIPLDKHIEWFSRKYLEKDEKKNKDLCYILKKDATAIGYCRFDWDEIRNVYIVSIALDPENQNKGMGNELLSNSLDELRILGKGNVLARIKKVNEASMKLFEKNNFKKINELEDSFEYKLDLKND